MTTMTPTTCRAARALLEMTQQQLAATAKVGLSTVKAFEVGRSTPVTNNLLAMQKALEDAGVLFIPENGGGVGVRLKDPSK